ncbi:cysteine desulfurase family protein [Miniimonas sp. S16]|nr:cysteine desulfurase family protein [Miniimonas sp. S16]
MSVYLDHAATTTVRPAALAALARAAERVGNPSSLHGAGRAARSTLEDARERIAAALGAQPAEVVLTSGGCEADTLAVVGGYLAARAADPARRRVVTSAVEHAAVRGAGRAVAEVHGGTHVVAPVGPDGVLDVAALEAELAAHARETAVVSVMVANNETGAIQPVEAVVAAVRREAGNAVLVHADAVQAVGHVPVDFGASDLDALSLSGHKLGAPAGIGALLVQRTTPLAPVIHGSGQERGVRSGTVPVALAAALAVAIEEAVAELETEAARLAGLRDELERGVRASVPDVRVNAADARLPGFLHLTLPGADVDALLFALDSWGVQASAGAACHAGVTQPSEVMLAVGDDEWLARSVLRLTLGWTSTATDVERALAVLPRAVERARAAGAVAARHAAG